MNEGIMTHPEYHLNNFILKFYREKRKAMFSIAIHHHCQPQPLVIVEKDTRESLFSFSFPVSLHSSEVSTKAVLPIEGSVVIQTSQPNDRFQMDQSQWPNKGLGCIDSQCLFCQSAWSHRYLFAASLGRSKDKSSSYLN